MSARRPWSVLLLLALFAGGGVYVVVRLLLPAPAPPVVVSKQVERPRALTRHLFFVVVDGLRYDFATDPARMPQFAGAMRRHTSAEMWAGRVTMTTSAVLSYGTGQRGSLEQVVRNANPAPPAFDTWLRGARGAGLRIAVAGDPAWQEMFGSYIDRMRPDPEGVAIDVDFNPQTFRDARELLAEKPNFMVAHFVTPDHQGHAYTLRSERYRAHLADFDAQLFRLLGELDPTWTVIATSDHGALDSGTHGGDVEVARRVPVFAYGPGIAPRVKLAGRLDQADLAGTMAALLGVPAPIHGRGHVLVEWLDVSESERAAIACADAARATAYAEAALFSRAAREVQREAAGCDSGRSPAARMASARAAVAALDRSIGKATGLASMESWLALLPLLALAVALAWLVLGDRVFRAVPLALALLSAAVALTYAVERAPGIWPNTVRVTLFVLANAGVLWLLLAPGSAAKLLERRPIPSACAIPGLLVASYTSNTQPESYVAIGVLALLFVRLDRIEPASPPLWRGRLGPALGVAGWVALLASLLVLFPAGTRQVELHPAWLQPEPRFFVLSALMVAGWLLLGVRGAAHPRRAWLEALLMLALIVGSLWWRRSAVPWFGRSALVAFGLLALVAAIRGEGRRALALGLASYAWVSRDFEVSVVVSSLIVGEIVGNSRATPSREPGLAEQLLLLTFAFGALYVQRIGITGALDFGAMDWGAAGFRDPHVPAAVVGTALVYKYLLAALLFLGSLLVPLPGAQGRSLLGALVVTCVVRNVVLLLMLFVCGTSYWTALRTVGDLPFPLIAALAAALAWVFVSSRRHEKARVPS